jgi:hypothetical protein
MSEIVKKIVMNVNAELDRIAKNDPAVAQAIREQIGPVRTWTGMTPGQVRTLELQQTDGRAG